MASLWHGVIALGTDGGDPCANGDTLGQGVHLLWTMPPELGFPIHGYGVLRRRHRQPQWTCTLFDADNVPPAGSPVTPVLHSAVGAPGTVVLIWRAGTEPDLSGYRIWRAERAGDLADVRRTPVYAEVAPAGDSLSQSWSDSDSDSDSGTAALTDYYYRVAAVDHSGVDAAQDPAQTYRPAVALAWTASEDDVTCRVERRLDGDRLYSARSDWLSPVDGTRGFAFADDASPSRATYRVRARDVAG